LITDYLPVSERDSPLITVRPGSPRARREVAGFHDGAGDEHRIVIPAWEVQRSRLSGALTW